MSAETLADGGGHGPAQVPPPAGAAGEPSAQARAIVRRIIAEQHDRPSLVSVIACDVGAAIVERLLRPGDDLNSVELARRYRTSRTPVREALMLLAKEGLVEILPRRRPRVARLGIEEIAEVYRVRAELLALNARRIARERSEAGLAELERILQGMERACAAGDVESYYWGNVDFHERSTELAGDRTVKRLLASLMLRTLPLRRDSLSLAGRMRRSLEDHARLFRAYQDQDEDLAAALIRSNVLAALAALRGAKAGA